MLHKYNARVVEICWLLELMKVDDNVAFNLTHDLKHCLMSKYDRLLVHVFSCMDLKGTQYYFGRNLTLAK